MMDLLFGNYASWFTVPAVVGTLYFFVQIVFMNVGGDMDMDSGGGDGGGSDLSIISSQSIAAFFMGAGWVGLSAYRVLDLGFSASCFAGVLGGVGAGWLLVATSKLVLKLQSSGNIAISEAVGLTGNVSVLVPAMGQGRGRVKLVVQSRLREFDAVQDGESPIATGARVKVGRVNTAANTLTVEQLE